MRGFIAMWKNTFNFKGRTRRRDFWGATLITWALIFGCVAIEKYTGVNFSREVYSVWSIIRRIFVPILLVPGISLKVRRYHDVGLSGMLILLDGITCGIMSLVVCFMSGKEEENRWGLPLSEEDSDDIKVVNDILIPIVLFGMAFIGVMFCSVSPRTYMKTGMFVENGKEYEFFIEGDWYFTGEDFEADHYICCAGEYEDWYVAVDVADSLDSVTESEEEREVALFVADYVSEMGLKLVELPVENIESFMEIVCDNWVKEVEVVDDEECNIRQAKLGEFDLYFDEVVYLHEDKTEQHMMTGLIQLDETCDKWTFFYFITDNYTDIYGSFADMLPRIRLVTE